MERIVDAQERRITSLDQRAGVLLGFAGVLMGLVVRLGVQLDAWSTAGGFSALGAAVFAAVALRPRTAAALDPTSLIEGYTARDEEETRFAVLSTVAALYAQEEEAVGRKAARIRTAGVLLVVSVTLLLLGAIVDARDPQEVWVWLR